MKKKMPRKYAKSAPEGRGVCGVYSKDIAASKVSAVLDFAQVYQHPLQCIMEKK